MQFAQAPHFNHLAAVYNSFDFSGPLDFVRKAADLSDRVVGAKMKSALADRFRETMRRTASGVAFSRVWWRLGRPVAVSHVRLRKFNTRDAYPEQNLDNDVCMVVRAGNTVYVRGQTAMDLDGKIVGIGDAAAQTENAMKCAKILLEEAGSKLEDIVKITIYITDRAYREAVYRVVGKWLKGVFPVSTGIIVQGLAKPEYLMEIDIIAEEFRRAHRAEPGRTVPAWHFLYAPNQSPFSEPCAGRRPAAGSRRAGQTSSSWDCARTAAARRYCRRKRTWCSIIW